MAHASAFLDCSHEHFCLFTIVCVNDEGPSLDRWQVLRETEVKDTHPEGEAPGGDESG